MRVYLVSKNTSGMVGIEEYMKIKKEYDEDNDDEEEEEEEEEDICNVYVYWGVCVCVFGSSYWYLKASVSYKVYIKGY